MKLLAVGDLQLNERGGLGPGRLIDQEQVWREILAVAAAEHVDAVLFGGDAFEHRRPTPGELRAFQRPLEDFRRDTKIPVLALAGNHDLENAERPCGLDLFGNLLTLHREPGFHQVAGVTIATLPWAPVARLAAQMNGGGGRANVHEAAAERLIAVAHRLRTEISGPAVLALHWDISGAAYPSGLPPDGHGAVLLPLGDLLGMEWDAVVAAHIHKPQTVIDGRWTDSFYPAAPGPPFLYVGSPMPQDHGEAGSRHGAWILEGPPFVARFVPIRSREFLTIDLDADEIWDEVPEMVERQSLHDAIVRVRYTATEERARRLDNAGIRRALLEAGAWHAEVKPTIQRAQSARVTAMTADLDETQALTLWLDEHGVTERRPDVLAAHERCMVAARERQRHIGPGAGLRPVRIEATNFRTFERLSVDIPPGCSAITAEYLNPPPGKSSNGGGKSTIPLALEAAFFGKAGRLTMRQLLMAGGVAEHVEAQATVRADNGDVYRVRSGYSVKGRGKPSADLERQTADGTWEPLGRQSTDETRRLVEDTFAVTHRVFRAACYIAQNDDRAFCDAEPSQRKGVLAESCLGRDPIWDHAPAGQWRKETQAKLAAVSARLEQAEQELAEQNGLRRLFAQAQDNDSDARAALEAAERHLEALTEQWQQADRRVAERRAAEAEHQAAEQARRRLREQAEQAESARENIRDAQGTIAELADAKALALAEQRYSEARVEYDRQAHEAQVLNAKRVESEQRQRDLEQEAASLEAQRAALSREADALENAPTHADVCPTCKRSLDDAEARHRVIESKWADMSGLEARILELRDGAREQEARSVALREELAALGVAVAPDDAEVRRAREQVQERARIEERISAWQQAVDAVDGREFEDRIMAADASLALSVTALTYLPPIDQAEIDRIKQHGLEARAHVNEQRQRLDEARTEKARLEARLERLAQVETQARIEREAKTELQDDVDVLTILERAYGRDGIPALIVENVAIPTIETEANRTLGELGTQMRVQLRSQRVTLDGELKDTLLIAVYDDDGNERDYLTYSGGEQERLRLALGIGLAVHIRGSRILILDEPKYLDSAGRSAIVQIMRRLETVFESILLISNEEELRDALDNVLHVIRDENGRSTVDTAATAATAAEPVAA